MGHGEEWAEVQYSPAEWICLRLTCVFIICVRMKRKHDHLKSTQRTNVLSQLLLFSSETLLWFSHTSHFHFISISDVSPKNSLGKKVDWEKIWEKKRQNSEYGRRTIFLVQSLSSLHYRNILVSCDSQISLIWVSTMFLLKFLWKNKRRNWDSSERKESKMWDHQGLYFMKKSEHFVWYFWSLFWNVRAPVSLAVEKNLITVCDVVEILSETLEETNVRSSFSS